MSKYNHPLRRAVIKQLGGLESFNECYKDVNQHGASWGFSGFIYYTDTVAFTKRHKQKIITCLESECREIGYSGLFEMLSYFTCFKDMSQSDIADGLYNPKSEYRTTIYNGLACYMLESVCQECEYE